MKTGRNKFIASLRKVDEPDREPGSILRRTDFNYMDGHGTFYLFDKDHFPDNLLDAQIGDHLSLVLYNLHTNHLDEVVFELIGKFKVGEKNVWFRGHILGSEDYYAIKIEYFLNRPLDS